MVRILGEISGQILTKVSSRLFGQQHSSDYHLAFAILETGILHLSQHMSFEKVFTKVLDKNFEKICPLRLMPIDGVYLPERLSVVISIFFMTIFTEC